MVYPTYDLRAPKYGTQIREHLKNFSVSNFKKSVKSELVKDY